MSKKRITLTEEDLRTAVKDVVRQFCEDVLTEGIDIDTDNKVISFNGSHQNNVDTNDYIHPHIIQNSVRGETVLSVFERKDNDEGNDGNPLVYALKGIRGWRFNNPRSDIMALLRRFVSVTSNLHIHFDTLIITLSNNELNNLIFSYLRRLVNFENHIESLFRKLTVSEVYEHYYDEEYFDKIAKSEQEAVFMRREMTTAFRKMNTQNNGIFSYARNREKANSFRGWMNLDIF